MYMLSWTRATRESGYSTCGRYGWVYQGGYTRVGGGGVIPGTQPGCSRRVPGTAKRARAPCRGGSGGPWEPDVQCALQRVPTLRARSVLASQALPGTLLRLARLLANKVDFSLISQ